MPQHLSITEFESAFQTLQYRLNLNISKRLKTRFLGDFCGLLLARENRSNSHSYYAELLPQFIEEISAESLKYQPIDTLLSLYESLRIGRSLPEFRNLRASSHDLLQVLKVQLMASYLFVSDYGSSLQVACGDLETELNLDGFSHVDSIESLYEEARHQQIPEEVLKIISKIQGQIRAETSGYSKASAWIPLVEKYQDHMGDLQIVGTVHALELEVEKREGNRSRDIISFNNHTLDQDDLVHYQAQDAILAARSEHGSLSRRSSDRYTVTFGFPSASHSYSGSSFGLGLALLALSTFEREANLRRQSTITQSVAFSGGIHLNGQTRGVSAVGLQEKISAAFHSPLSGMVLPSQNVVEGQRYLGELLDKYPSKKFTLLPATSIADLMDNRSILRSENVPVLRWVSTKVTRMRALQIFLAMLFAIAGTLAWLGLVVDHDPFDYRVGDESIFIFNKNGRFLWDFHLGHPSGYLKDPHSENPIYRSLHIHDFDADGASEVLLGTSVKQHDLTGRIYLLETDGQVRWMFSKHPTLRYGKAEYSANYGVGFIYPFHTNNTLYHDIYVGFNHMIWFPNRLVRLDINGNQLDEFIHPGKIYDMDLMDLDQDGEFEMLLGCTSNDFNTAALVILPAQGFQGTVPSWNKHNVLDGSIVDSNLVYIKFPEWGDYELSGTRSRSKINEIFLDGEEGFFVKVAMVGSPELGAYVYSFDTNMNLRGITITDDLRDEYHTKYGEDFFETHDHEKWLRTMGDLAIWKHGEWNQAGKRALAKNKQLLGK